LLNGIDQYAQAPQAKTLPPYPYGPQSSSESVRQPPPYTHPTGAGQRQDHNPAPYSSVGQAPPSRASISNMLSNPTGTPKPPMYAVTPSSSVVYAAQTPTEYLAYVMKFPYLKNAYLRRAKTYVSPYSPGGGFTEQWMPKLPDSKPGPPTAIAPRPSGPSTAQPFYHGQQATPTLPAPRPTAQFQSSDAFQRDMARTSQPPEGTPKWEQMLKQLATSTGPTALPTATAGSQDSPQAPQPRCPPPPSRSSMQYDIPRSMQVSQNHAPPLPPPREPQRPTPSPISDDGKGVVGVTAAQGTPTLPPLQSPAQVHGVETWRYS
jgi:hypothetical protein